MGRVFPASGIKMRFLREAQLSTGGQALEARASHERPQATGAGHGSRVRVQLRMIAKRPHRSGAHPVGIAPWLFPLLEKRRKPYAAQRRFQASKAAQTAASSSAAKTMLCRPVNGPPPGTTWPPASWPSALNFHTWPISLRWPTHSPWASRTRTTWPLVYCRVSGFKAMAPVMGVPLDGAGWKKPRPSLASRARRIQEPANGRRLQRRTGGRVNADLHQSHSTLQKINQI